MKDQKVSTLLGTIILIIIAATVAGFVLICFKNYPIKNEIASGIPGYMKKSMIEEDEYDKVADMKNDENLYVSEEFGIKFEYPEDWMVEEYLDSSPEMITITKYINEGTDGEVQVFFAGMEYFSDLNDIGIATNGVQQSIDISELKQVNINGNYWYTGECLTHSCMGPGDNPSYLIKSGEGYVYVQLNATLLYDDFDQMMHSIELINN